MNIIIPLDHVKQNFYDHLSKDYNKSIFLSGKFGSGKTYFLKEFFKEYKDNFEPFYLYPVNYQITANDDIINLIKYDLIIELINKNEDIFNETQLIDFVDLTNLIYIYSEVIICT